MNEEVVDDSPLIGELVTPDILNSEYINSQDIGRPGFLAGVNYLSKTYNNVRKVKGDGNCFYRAFLFSYLERIHRDHDDAERLRILNIFSESKSVVISQGYDEFVIESFYDVRPYCIIFIVMFYLLSYMSIYI
mgnify:CR=1 FL=1